MPLTTQVVLVLEASSDFVDVVGTKVVNIEALMLAQKTNVIRYHV